MRKLLLKLLPPSSWKLPVTIVVGIITGLAFFLIYSSNAVSYISDYPQTCVNCHIMAPQYATWAHSSHREAAHCNDCHVPHNNAFSKYYFKAKDGLRHASIFTQRKEPQVIFIHDEGARVVQNNCIRCHNDLITNSRLMHQTKTYINHFSDRFCWECHRETPHGRVNSLSSVPFARVPTPESIVPEWLKQK